MPPFIILFYLILSYFNLPNHRHHHQNRMEYNDVCHSIHALYPIPDLQFMMNRT